MRKKYPFRVLTPEKYLQLEMNYIELIYRVISKKDSLCSIYVNEDGIQDEKVGHSCGKPASNWKNVMQ